MMTIKEKIIDANYDHEIVFTEGFDDAIIGCEWNLGRVIYDIDEMINILMQEDGLELLDAIEFLEFNVLTAYVGEMTPIYVNTYRYD